jgi:hypothetical protein
MTRKSRVLYDVALGKVIDIFDRYIAVDLVMSDYEAAIQGYMSAVFHGSECIGSFFHYAQVEFFKLFCLIYFEVLELQMNLNSFVFI